MADRSLTRVQGGVTDTIHINTDKFAGVRTMTVNGETVTVNRTAHVIDSDRKGESRPLLSKVVGGAAAAYSLRDLNDKQGNNKVVRVRRGGDNSEQDFTASQISSGALTSFVNEAGFRFNLEESATYGEFADGDSQQIYASNADNTVWTGETTSSHTFQYTGSAWFYRYTDSATGNIYQVTANADSTHPYNANWFSSTVTTSTYNTGSYYGQSANLFADIGYFFFASPSDGFVETWYDQSGNDVDATQATASKQPKIVTSGVLNTDGIKFDGTNDFLDAVIPSINSSSALSVFTAQYQASKTILGDTTNRRLRFGSTTAQFYLSILQINQSYTSVPSGQTSLFSAIHNGTNSVPNVAIHANGNAAAQNSGNQGSLMGNIPIDYIGKNQGSSGTSFYNQFVQEIIIYRSDQTANRPAIEANINNQYDIY